MSDIVKSKLDIDGAKIGSDWGVLEDTLTTTITSITGQLGLVNMFRKEYVDNMPDDVNITFEGFALSFKDLLRDTIKNGCRHATSLNKKSFMGDVDDIEYGVTFRKDNVEEKDEVYEYINIINEYIMIQDKLQTLTSVGWPDLFIRLKLDPKLLTDK